MDPHCFDADPDPAQNLDADPDPDPEPGGGGGVHPPWQNPRYAPATGYFRYKHFIHFTVIPTQCCGSGFGAFLTPGSGMGKKSGSGSTMNNPDHISESLKTIFWVKILKFVDVDPGRKNSDPE